MEPARPPVSKPTVYGNAKAGKFWVEYPSGLIDITAEHPPAFESTHEGVSSVVYAEDVKEPPASQPNELEFSAQGDRRVRLDTKKTALVVIDMQNFFLHPDRHPHPSGLACVQPLVELVPFFRKKGIQIVWCNWGLTEAELLTIPPSLARSFSRKNSKGFGSELPGGFGRMLMRGERNSELYGPLQELYLEGKEKGTDVWIHKNRMSGIWGGQSELDLYLQNQGLETLLFAGVNADQCVLGTVIDAYYKGYNCILVEDCIATTSPEGGKSNIVYNSSRAYGFVCDHVQIMQE